MFLFDIFLSFKESATHGCEILHLFDFNYFVVPFTRSEADERVTKIISTFFTNFAKCGSPNFDETNPFSISHDLHWDPIKLENPINCLTIGIEPKMEEIERLKRCIPQSEAYSKLHEWLTVMDENVYNEFKANVKTEIK
uniref:Carboxylesterase type B domain-containing protein n=1 Tax=Panagrolaimus davidi TaxID=227884 RepID=A0A914QUE5_9BILA